MTESAPRGLPYHELQQKILPELHLIAAGYGIENYRKLKKDALALAIMEHQAQAEGQVLARGFLEISPDGYGFLQSDLLDPQSRTVLVTQVVVGSDLVLLNGVAAGVPIRGGGYGHGDDHG